MHLHKNELVIRTPDATVMVCVECKKKFVFKKDRYGRMDNRKYYRINKRDFLQPGAKYYNKYYGKD